jgi:hypothetical protein
MQPANWAPWRVRIRQRRCLGWPKLRRRPKLHSRMSLPNVKERRFSKRMRDPFSQAGNRAFRVLAPRSSRKPPISSKHGPELTSRRNWRRRFRPPSQTRFSEKAIWPSPGRNAPQLSRYWKRSSARSLGVSAASQEDCEVRTGASPGGHGSSRGQQNGFCGHDAECGQGFTPFSKSSRRRRDSGRFVRHRRGSNNRGWVAHLLTGVAALSVGSRRQGPALVLAGGVGPRLSLHVERVEIPVQAFVRRLSGVDRSGRLRRNGSVNRGCQVSSPVYCPKNANPFQGVPVAACTAELIEGCSCPAYSNPASRTRMAISLPRYRGTGSDPAILPRRIFFRYLCNRSCDISSRRPRARYVWIPPSSLLSWRPAAESRPLNRPGIAYLE